MQIESGLFDHMVLQRNRKNVSEALFSGLCSAKGPVTAMVRRGRNVVKGFSGAAIGTAARGRLSGCLKGLPAGGPYDIELKAGVETLTVQDVLVGDVWLLGGQSNMQGCGFVPKQPLQADEQVRAFYMNDRWAVAKDPIHNMWECVDQVHIDICGARPAKPGRDWGVCPGPAFGNEMRRLTGVPQGLVACAHGGTSMQQWAPGLKKEGGKSLYGATVRRLRKNGGRVAGLVWYQGCSDASPGDAKVYTARMKALVAAFRRDAGDSAMPVAIVQLARVVGAGVESVAPWNSIRDQQRRLPGVVKQLTAVPAIDLPLDDGIHISGAGQYVLGRRLAQAMQALRAGRKAGLQPPIEFANVAIEMVRGAAVAVVEFANVAGGLTAGARPCGFSIVTENSSANQFDIQLDGRKARIRTGLTSEALAGAMLYYGYGTDPYCNITDAAGRSLPALGPVPMGVPHAITPYIQCLRVSAFQPSAGKLDELECPSGFGAFGMTTRKFGDAFCNLHPEISRRGGQDELVYYAIRFSCGEPMDLSMVLGYDGPVKAWVDGHLLVHDPHGTNPATPEKARVPFKAGTGEHEFVVALGTNGGAAWGIFLRLERIGLPKAKLVKGPEGYSMPEILG